MKTIIYPLLALLSLSISGCGRKMAPKPPEGVEIIYPSHYPKPNCKPAAKPKKKTSFSKRKKL